MVVPFTHAMREQMTSNENLKKTRWVECELRWLEAHLQHQVNQLNVATLEGERQAEVLKKAVDVANVARQRRQPASSQQTVVR